MASIELNLDWAELDLYGHINNVAYYRYMQTARISFCESVGLTTTNEPGKQSFILAASNCNYKQKLHYPGCISIQSKVVEINNSSFHLLHQVFNQDGELAAEGTDVLVLYDYKLDKKTPISDPMRLKLKNA